MLPSATRRYALAGVVVVAIGAWIGLGVARWEPGWSALTWDDFTRVILAKEWAARPFLTVDGLVWLPLQTWVYGAAIDMFGGAFRESPMALIAIVNSVAALATAAIVALTAWRLFRSASGAVVAFIVVLFSPWVSFAALSGLTESFWYLAVAGAVAGLVGWVTSGSRLSLGLGAVAVAAGAALRYDGWTFAIAWGSIVAIWALGLFPRVTGRSVDGGLREAVRRNWPVLAIAAAPLLVPVAYVVINYIDTGDPLFFAKRSSELFRNAFGSLGGPARRLTYYPGALLRSAPLLLPVLIVAGVAARQNVGVRIVGGLVALHFVLFVGPSLVSSAVGAFPERFMFALVVGLAPLAGAIPSALRRLQPTTVRAVAVALIAVGAIVAVVRTVDRPVAWTHGPDLLELNEALGEATADGDTLVVGLAPGLQPESLPLAIQNGSRVGVQLLTAEEMAAGPSGVDILVERSPLRILEAGREADAIVGRYHLYGTAAAELDLDTAGCGCEGWMHRTEDGDEFSVRPSPYMAVEFVTDDPRPGDEVSVYRAFDQGGEAVEHTHDVRWLFGQGFNTGRLLLEVRVDGDVIFDGTIGERSRWIDVEYTIPAGDGLSIVEIAVVAQPDIEFGWGWGRSSAILITGGET